MWKEKLDKFLKEWKNQNSNDEDSYYEYKYNEEEDKEYSFDEEVYNLLSSYKDLIFTLSYIGSFNSPGYDATYCCLVIYDNSKLYDIPIIFETW